MSSTALISGKQKAKYKNSLENFNIYVVEDHNDVLTEIYKEIGSKRLSFNDLTLIHFDSHPDLGIPNIAADTVFDRDHLIESLSIENWILPAVYAGHINKIVWIKPKWANQISTGEYRLIIGKHHESEGGLIKCNSKEDYFLGDMMYANETELKNKKEFLLYVCDFDTIVNETDTFLMKILTDIDCKRKIIFDIDLDFFSTLDPFKRMFSSDREFEVYKSVYKTKPDFDKNSNKFDFKYREYIKTKNEKLAHISKIINGEIDEENSPLLKQLIEIIKKNKLDIDILHSYGSCLDEVSLPDHKSTTEEILSMIEQFESFLNKYFSPNSLQISIMTIARSSLDDYCPPDQVDFIQEEVLNRVKNYYNQKNENDSSSPSIGSINLVYLLE